ncbi:MAG: hypothetical protein ABIQ79_09675, partial [Nitrospiraceae bacterium]
NRWTHINQMVAFCRNVVFFLLFWIHWSGSRDHLISAIGAATLGTFVVPIATSLVSGLQSLKDIKK